MNSATELETATIERVARSGSVARGGRFSVGRPFLCSLIVFVVALSAALSHNFLEKKTITTYFADSRHYLESANIISSVMLDLGRGKNSLPRMLERREREHMLMDGPILPLFFGSVFAAIGHAPISPDWKLIVVIQSLLHALSAAVLCSLLNKIVNKIGVAFAVALAWALYPAALIATERMMTETLACFLIVALLWTLSESEKKVWWAPVAGLLLAVSWILKAVLVPPVIATLTLAGFSRRLKPLSLALVISIIVLVIAPWAVYTKYTYGRMQITTERSATHNAFIGWDLENDGWQATFPTKKERLFLSGDPLSALTVQIKRDPSDMIALLLKKFSRFYGYPYNDFKHSCFGINHLQFIWIHQLYVLLGLMGICLYVFGGYRLLTKDQRYLANLSLIFLVFQQSVFLVEANTRYGFTAFPLLSLFAGVGLYCAIYCSKTMLGRVKECLPGALFGLSLAVFVLNSESIVNRQVPGEVQYKLGTGQSIEKTFDFAGAKVPPKLGAALILIDGDSGLENALVELNGQAINFKPLPLNYFDSKLYRQFNLMKECSYCLNIGVERFRQWRAVPVPVELLRLNQENTVKITARGSPVTIYGEQDRNSRRILATETVCVNRLLSSPTDLEVRPYDPVLTARVRTSVSQYLDRVRQPVDTGARVHLALYRRDSGTEINSATTTPESFVRPFKQDDFGWLLRVYNSEYIRVGKYVTNSAITASTVSIPPFSGCTHLKVAISGQVRGWERSGTVGIVSTVGNPKGSQFLLARLPFSIPVEKAWTRFAIEDVVPVSVMDGGISTVSIGLYPGPWPEVAGYGTNSSNTNSLLKNLEVKVTPLTWLDVRGRKAILY